MRKFIQFKPRLHWLMAGAIAVAFSTTFIHSALAEEEQPAQVGVEITGRGEPVNGDDDPAEFVSIHVDGGQMRQVLNSFAMQANRNIVLGPEVTNDTVTIHLNNVQWDNALDVILKPYGYGYRQVGEAIVVGELGRLKALETIEPLQSRVYQLRYLDTGDVKDIIEGQLSPRGKMSIITARGQKGWKDLGQKSRRRAQGSGGSLDMRSREKDEQVRSKTIVLTDVPSVLDNVAETLAKIDKQPNQVLVEARFMEVNEDVLRDIGAQFGVGWNNAGTALGFNQRVFNNEPSSFNPVSQTLSGAGSSESPDLTGGPTALLGSAFLDALLSSGSPFAPTNLAQLIELDNFLDSQIPASQAGSILDTGGQFFGLGSIDNVSMELYINLLEEDEDTKTLSAPKVLTLNNQEAAIVVGTRYPIISSTTSSGPEATKSERLEYYESVGIQLNVVPQICADGYINMVVRPSVTEIIGFNGINDYPIIKTRDTETQILAADGETVVIGGLLEERLAEGLFKVPFLGDIPILGRLFRRETKDTMTIDLLIFLKATVVSEENYDIILEGNDEEPVVIEVSDEAMLETEELVTVEASAKTEEPLSTADMLSELE